MEVRIVTRIGDIDAAIWDGLVGDHPFSQHRFIEVLERSAIPDVKLWHVLFLKSKVPIACTSIYSHPFSPDLIAPSSIRQWTGAINRLSGDLLKTRILLCGLPISLGKSHLWFRADADEETVRSVWERLDRLLQDLAKKEAIPLWGAKEFDRRNLAATIGKVAGEAGYVLCHSLSTVTVKIQWRTFAEYLTSLRASYRRQALADMKRSEKHGVHWVTVRGDQADPDVLYELYRHVFARADNRLEALTREFFVEVGKSFPREIEIVQGIYRDRVVAYGLLFHHGQKTHFLFAGLEYRLVKQFGLYRNLLLQLVRAATQRGAEVLELGQTSYDIKQRIGGLPRPLVFYLKHRHFLGTQALRGLAPLLFPEVSHERRNVFRQDPSDSRAGAQGPPEVSGVPAGAVPKRSQLDSAA